MFRGSAGFPPPCWSFRMAIAGAGDVHLHLVWALLYASKYALERGHQRARAADGRALAWSPPQAGHTAHGSHGDQHATMLAYSTDANTASLSDTADRIGERGQDYTRSIGATRSVPIAAPPGLLVAAPESPAAGGVLVCRAGDDEAPAALAPFVVLANA